MAGVFLPVVTICRPLLPLAAEKKYKKKEHKEKGMQSNDVKEIGVNYRMFFFFLLCTRTTTPRLSVSGNFPKEWKEGR